MSETQINEGDVVRLKSGGPEMTIESVTGLVAHCTWFDSNDKTESKEFKLTMLQLVSEEPPPVMFG